MCIYPQLIHLLIISGTCIYNNMVILWIWFFILVSLLKCDVITMKFRSIKIQCVECKRDNELVFSATQMTYVLKCECGRVVSLQSFGAKQSLSVGKQNNSVLRSSSRTIIADKTPEEIEELLGKRISSKKNEDKLYPLKPSKVFQRVEIKRSRNHLTAPPARIIKSQRDYFNYKPGWQPQKVYIKDAGEKIASPPRSISINLTNSKDYDEISADSVKQRTCPLCGHSYKGGPICPRKALHFRSKKPASHRFSLPKDAAIRDFLKESHSHHTPLDRD